MESNAIIQEWSRRQKLYKTKTRPFNTVGLVVAIPALIIAFIGPTEGRAFALLVFLLSVTIAGAGFAIFTDKYLRCPNCETVPGFRGGAYSASVCRQCQARLVESLLVQD